MRALFVFENVLNEISLNSTLYHRSMKEMKVGEVINPKTDKTGSHWIKNDLFEKAMEHFRQKNFPDAPSRINAIYCSVIPRSRFKDKGYLYTVKPVGKILMTNSRLIDKMKEKFDSDMFDYIDRRYGDYSEGKKQVEQNIEELEYILDGYLAEHYWSGRYIGDREATEVICESAVVTGIIGSKPKDLMPNDTVEITENNKVMVESTIYFEQPDLIKYKEKEKTIINFINSIKKLYVKPEVNLSEYEFGNRGGNLKIKGFIKKGTNLKILYALSNMMNAKHNDSYSEQRENYKYKRIGFEPTSINKTLEFNMEYWFFFSRDIRNVSKYLKKI